MTEVQSEIRPATASDAQFIASGIIQAEQTPSGGMTTYEAVYGMSRDEVLTFLSGALGQSSEHPLSFRTFVVAERAGRRVGCCAAWLEAVPPSGSRTVMELSRFLGPKRWMSAIGNVRALAASTPPRAAGTLQVDSVFVVDAVRGTGLAGALVIAAISQARSRNAAVVSEAEIQLYVENEGARRAYEKVGFRARPGRVTPTDVFARLTASKGICQMALPLQHFG